MEDDIYEVLEDFIPSEADKTAEELKVSSGDLVNVITKQPSGWWFVQLVRPPYSQVTLFEIFKKIKFEIIFRFVYQCQC